MKRNKGWWNSKSLCHLTGTMCTLLHTIVCFNWFDYDLYIGSKLFVKQKQCMWKTKVLSSVPRPQLHSELWKASQNIGKNPYTINTPQCTVNLPETEPLSNQTQNQKKKKIKRLNNFVLQTVFWVTAYIFGIQNTTALHTNANFATTRGMASRAWCNYSCMHATFFICLNNWIYRTWSALTNRTTLS